MTYSAQRREQIVIRQALAATSISVALIGRP